MNATLGHFDFLTICMYAKVQYDPVLPGPQPNVIHYPGKTFFNTQEKGLNIFSNWFHPFN